MVNRMNADLANGLGNLAQRTLTLINRNCDGKVPTPGVPIAADDAPTAAAKGLLAKLRADFADQAFHRALETLWQVVAEADRYIDEQAPWALHKTDPQRAATVLYGLAEVIRHLAILVQPVMPQSAAKLLDQLAVPPERRDFASLDRALAPGTPLPKPEGVFPRYVEG
jgi:methionyl-tRNA synthetase